MVGYTTLVASLDWFRWLLLGVTMGCALLMVSTIRYPHIGNTLFGRIGFGKLIIIMLLGALFFWQPATVLAVATVGYLVLGLLLAVVRLIRDWRAGRSGLEEDEEEASAEDVGLPGSAAHHEGPAPGR
jgi:phosphatidylserine synthase